MDHKDDYDLLLSAGNNLWDWIVKYFIQTIDELSLQTGILSQIEPILFSIENILLVSFLFEFEILKVA